MSAPKIGFDRYIALDWSALALRVKAGFRDEEELFQLLEETHPGLAARKKTRTILNRLWLQPRPELEDFSERAVSLYREAPDTPLAALTWGMTIATYPFFGKVAEILGRLFALQNECKSSEVHRRMSELFGEREGTKRMTNMILQSQADWGAIERLSNGQKLVQSRRMQLEQPTLIGWLVEAALRYTERPIPLAGVGNAAILYPFDLGARLAYVISNTSTLEISNDAAGKQLVGLRER
ncbi:MAG: hypothetical protein ACQETX_16635 [Pseudomonadota bacterium]